MKVFKYGIPCNLEVIEIWRMLVDISLKGLEIKQKIILLFKTY